MKRTKLASKKDRKADGPQECPHLEVYAVAAFVDEHAGKAFLLQVCEDCGKDFLLMGQYPLTVC